MNVTEPQVSCEPGDVPRLSACFSRRRALPIIQGDLIRNKLAPGVFGVVRESAGMLGYVAGFVVALVVSPISRPKRIRHPRPSVQEGTNVIPFPSSKL